MHISCCALKQLQCLYNNLGQKPTKCFAVPVNVTSTTYTAHKKLVCGVCGKTNHF